MTTNELNLVRESVSGKMFNTADDPALMGSQGVVPLNEARGLGMALRPFPTRR
jgi:hypothetical protein